jgi:type I restriction enzyme, R subunit
LIALAERAAAVQSAFEDRQTTTADALSELLCEIRKNEERKREQAERGLDALGYFVLRKLMNDGIPNPEVASRKITAALTEFSDWSRSETALREVRQKVTFALVHEEDDLEKVTATVESLFILLRKGFKP